jgi:hypothetical protein
VKNLPKIKYERNKRRIRDRVVEERDKQTRRRRKEMRKKAKRIKERH